MDRLSSQAGSAEPKLVLRHRWPTRLWHWLNALLLYTLFASGLGIFNAHPRLYWGQYGANFDRPWLELGRFGRWLTLPAHYDLAMSRHWHLTAAPIFAFALLLYMLWSLFGGHLGRDLAFRRGSWRPATSGRTSGTMPGCASRPAKRRCGTMYCKREAISA